MFWATQMKLQVAMQLLYMLLHFVYTNTTSQEVYVLVILRRGATMFSWSRRHNETKMFLPVKKPVLKISLTMSFVTKVRKKNGTPHPSRSIQDAKKYTNAPLIVLTWTIRIFTAQATKHTRSYTVRELAQQSTIQQSLHLKNSDCGIPASLAGTYLHQKVTLH